MLNERAGPALNERAGPGLKERAGPGLNERPIEGAARGAAGAAWTAGAGWAAGPGGPRLCCAATGDAISRQMAVTPTPILNLDMTPLHMTSPNERYASTRYAALRFLKLASPARLAEVGAGPTWAFRVERFLASVRGKCGVTVAMRGRSGDIATRLPQRYGRASRIVAMQNVDAGAALEM